VGAQRRAQPIGEQPAGRPITDAERGRDLVDAAPGDPRQSDGLTLRVAHRGEGRRGLEPHRGQHGVAYELVRSRVVRGTAQHVGGHALGDGLVGARGQRGSPDRVEMVDDHGVPTYAAPSALSSTERLSV
jgi:hypothetical protein